MGYYLFGVRIHSPKYRQVQLIRCLLIQKRLAHDANLLITANSVTLNTVKQDHFAKHSQQKGKRWGPMSTEGGGGGRMGAGVDSAEMCCSSAKVKMDRVNTALIIAVE